MHCQKARQAITLYLDKELEKAAENEFLGHIKFCVKCREEMEFRSRILKYVAIPEPIEPSPYFFSKVKAKIKSIEGHSIFSPARWQLTFASAGLFAIMALVPFVASIFLGNIYMSQTTDTALVSNQKTKTALGLDVFDELPPDSLGATYNEIIRGV